MTTIWALFIVIGGMQTQFVDGPYANEGACQAIAESYNSRRQPRDPYIYQCMFKEVPSWQR